MRVPTEYLISHGWLLIPAALLGLLALSLGFFMLSGYPQNSCSGLDYFGFVDHKSTTDYYTIQLVNGNMPVIVRSVMAGSVEDPNPSVSMENIQPGNVFIIRTKPLGIGSGSQFANTVVRINYEIINGETNRADTAVCSGRVS